MRRAYDAIPPASRDPPGIFSSLDPARGAGDQNRTVQRHTGSSPCGGCRTAAGAHHTPMTTGPRRTYRNTDTGLALNHTPQTPVEQRGVVFHKRRWTAVMAVICKVLFPSI